MNDLKAVDSTNKDNERVDQNISVVVEKWMNRHNLKTLQRNDSQLETGVGGHEIIEDELVKRCTRMVLVSQKEKRNNRCIFFSCAVTFIWNYNQTWIESQSIEDQLKLLQSQF